MNFPLFTILVVDDNPENRLSISNVLTNLSNCRLIMIGSGAEVLNQTLQQTVNLIILSADIADADSFEIARDLSLNNHACHIPIIFTSRISAPEFIQRGYQIGAVDYLITPLDANLLLNRIKSHRVLFDREQLLAQSLSQLKVSEQRLSYALEATQEGLWDWHIPTNTVYFSPPFENILGVPPGSLEPTLEAIFNRLHPEEAESVKAVYQKLATGPQERIEIEYRLRSDAQLWVWVLAQGKVVEYTWQNGHDAADTKTRTKIPVRAVGTISDISARVAAEQQLRRAAAVTEHMSDALAILNADETILSVNPAFVRATGYPAVELLGKPIALLGSGRHHAPFFDAIRRALKENGTWKGEIWNRRANGECYPEWLNISVLRDIRGEIKHYICIYSDLSTQEHVRKRLHQLAYYDTLTGLANREMFQDRLASTIFGAKREGYRIAVLIIDLDKFKEINEIRGYYIGDETLIGVGKRIEECVQNGDTVARLGADKFAVLLPHIHDAGSVAIVAEKIINTLCSPFDLTGEIIHLSLCIGISLYPQDGVSLEELLSRTELALNQAKKAGPNNYRFCSAEMTKDVHESFHMTAELHQAFELNEFVLYFQPLIDIVNNILVGAEVLVRWQHHNPPAAVISPGIFLPVAEKAGLMAKLDELILRKACRQLYEWQKQGFVLPRIAVNLSGSILEQTNLANLIINILQHTELPVHCLELEISEGFIMSRAEKAVVALDSLHKMGISLALDDFGTGYSSLSYLKKLPIDRLKIDQSFVRDLPGNAHDASIARAIIALGKSLGLKIIAEGIEKTEQCNFLQREGCDEGQGFLFGRPMPADQFYLWANQYAK